MKARLISVGAAVIWAAVATMPTASPLYGQRSSAGGAAAMLRPASPPQSVILREIDDPATGNRWFLEQEAGHPGGPGRLVLVTGSHAAIPKMKRGAPAARVAAPVMPVLGIPAIRAGDAVTLVAHTTVMDAELEAVALAPAAVGAAFPVRLKMGGKVVDAVALAAGHAQWAPGSGETR